MGEGGGGVTWECVHVFENWREKNVSVSALSPIGTPRGIDDGQMDGETKGQVSRKCDRGTYKPTDGQNYLLPKKPKHSIISGHYVFPAMAACIFLDLG
jgi:hypothetical protein